MKDYPYYGTSEKNSEALSLMKLYENIPTKKWLVTKILPDRIMKKHAVQFGEIRLSRNERDELDEGFYRAYYDDLSSMTNFELRSHWKGYGKDEGRLPTLLSYLKMQLKDSEKVNAYMSYAWFYREIHSDLKAAGLDNYRLFIHYFQLGNGEGRHFLPEDWLKDRGIQDQLLLKRAINALEVFYVKKKTSQDGTFLEAAKSLTGMVAVPFNCFGEDRGRTVRLYTDLSLEMLQLGRKTQAKNLLNNAIYYGGSSRAYELLGNLFLDEEDFERAEELFKESIKVGDAGEWVYKNLSNIYIRRMNIDEAVEIIEQGIGEKPESELIASSFPACMSLYWEETSRRLDGLKVLPNSRKRMIDLARFRTKRMYDSWFNLFSMTSFGYDSSSKKVLNNAERILIIGDFHLAQCVRYRIDQKIEQLVTQGHEVEAVSWTDLGSTSVNLPLYDVVIFYRVPAVDLVVKQIAFSKAMNKVVIYEVDDQIFLPSYPGAIESYGGKVDHYLYQDLVKGMSLNNAAITLCDYAIASTNPLGNKLEELVCSSESYVHRNGLDSLSWLGSQAFKEKGRITIFYGSGTLAHNSDFLELALPAIERLLKEFNHVRLLVMGHLELPEEFKEQYAGQFMQLPKLNDVKTYSAFLSKVDINIAVLHDDEINAAKSELKWFEAACFKVPSVLSSTENYRDVIRHGEDAFLAESVSDWYDYLKLLIVDGGVRHAVGSNAQARVSNDYSLEFLGRGLSEYIFGLARPDSVEKKTKICLVNVFFPPQSLGGATRVVADNFDVLVEEYKNEFDLCVFTTEANHGEPHRVSAYTYNGVRVYKSSVLFRENMDWQPKDNEMYKVFQEFLYLERPDKVHFHCIQRLTASVVEATRDLGIPYVITAHDAWWISDHQFLVDDAGTVYPDGHTDYYAQRVLPNNVRLEDSLAREVYLSELIGQAESVLTVSDAFAEIYKSSGVPSIQVTKNGISSNIEWGSKDTSYTEKVICGHIGGMSAHKGYELFKKAITKLQPQNIEVLVVDHSKPSDHVGSDYWGGVRVVFVGRQKQEDIVDLYRKIDVLFAPSIWPESFGLVTREAAACGCWVVASNIGAIGEDVIEGESGYIIDPTESGVADILTKIDKDAECYKKPSSSGELGSVSKQVEELVQFYRV